MNRPRLLLGSVVALLLSPVLTGVNATALASDAPAPTPSPTLTDPLLRARSPEAATKLLGRARNGPHALDSLTATTRRAAAAVNHTSVAHLRTVLGNDPTVWLGVDGRLFYADTLDAAQTHTAAADTVAAAQWSTYPLADAFTLHSDPGSAHTIYLDFTGYTLPAGAWWAGNGIPAGTYGGFSIDGSTGSFSTTEEQYIQDVWRIVAEKYSAMDVDVTTEDPGQDAYNRTSSGDPTYGTHVVITSDMSARGSICTATSSGGCVGIGIIDVFNAVEPTPDYLEPAWVYTKFTAADTTLPAGVVANDAAHEIGHTLGLYHDRTSGTNYYPGHDDWFAIMGSSDLAVGQFNDGGYTGAVTDQVDPGTSTPDPDDFNVMHLDGLPTRSDDIPGTKALGSAASYSDGGVIETAADVDTFSVNRTCTNALTATATGIGMGQAVDLKVTIRDPSNVVQASDDPAAGHLTPRTWPDTPTGMDASAEVGSAGPGLWTISVEGVGLAGSTGYPDYGSVGQYNLAISGCSGSGGTAPDAPTGGTVTLSPRTTTATINWVPPASPGTSAITGYTVSGTPSAVPDPAAGATSASLTGLVPGTTYQVKVAAYNDTGGTGASLTIPVRVSTWAPTTAPGLKLSLTSTNAALDWSVPANPGNATPTTWRITVNGKTYDAAYGQYKGILVGNGRVTARLVLYVTADDGTVTPAATRTYTVGATAPRIGKAISGKKGKPVTAGIKWAAPASLGGYPITGWKVIASKLNSRGKVVRSYLTKKLGARARSFTGKLPKGRYKFRVVAYNALGASPLSAYSKIARAR